MALIAVGVFSPLLLFMRSNSLTPSLPDGATEDIMCADNGVEAKADSTLHCASCGKGEIDGIKLKPCNSCDRVHYCGDECQFNHRQIHEADCKERAAVLREELLMRMPESSHLGDCPICFLPLPMSFIHRPAATVCCSTSICYGCIHFHSLSAIENGAKILCPMCRKPIQKTDKQRMKDIMKRVAVGDPVAMRRMGFEYRNSKDYENAVKYFTQASELGDAVASSMLAQMFNKGEGVEKDLNLEVHFLEEASIAGHPLTRHHLGLLDYNNERYDRAVKHWIISAKLGHKESIKELTSSYKKGYVSKDDFAAALRAHQAALDEMSSPQRDVAEAFLRQQDRKKREAREILP